jgi:hypothetical protein
MNESNSLEPPAWVLKRDGQRVPFDADKISRALFAAGESLGRPDAFLARELADGVVHFLTLECEGITPTTQQIAEIVEKIVRELGQPALAEAFARCGQDRKRPVAKPQAAPKPAAVELSVRLEANASLETVLASCVRQYTLQTVYARDLASAQSEGLLTLTGMDAPNELAGCVWGPPLEMDDAPMAALVELRRFVSRFVVIDGPEHLLASQGQSGFREFARSLVLGLRATGLHGVVNLNGATPPSWAGQLAAGPLFAAQQPATTPEHLQTIADELIEELLQPKHPVSSKDILRIDWHLGENDFTNESRARERLLRLCRWALAGEALAFVFDRPRRSTALSEGIDRQHPALLLTVGLNLPRLALQPGIDGEPAKFLMKLGSLARLALSAGVQKREYLRRLERNRPLPSSNAPALSSGFLLDRARLLVAPVGLESVVQSFVKKGLSSGGAALEFGRQIVSRLRDVLRQDGRNVHLDTCIDGPFSFHLDTERPSVENAAGLTAWDTTATLKSQLRAAGVLHGVAEHGTLALILPQEDPLTPEQLADCLNAARQHSDVVRIRLLQGLHASERATSAAAYATDLTSPDA